MINLICDRALHLGFNARAECIEPQFVWDAVHDLGLEISPKQGVRESVACRTQKARRGGNDTTADSKAEPAPLASERMHARSAVRVPRGEGQLLTDFAPESDLDVPVELVNDSIARGWLLVAAATVVAVLALAVFTSTPACRQPAGLGGEVPAGTEADRRHAPGHHSALPFRSPRFQDDDARRTPGRAAHESAGYYTTRAVARELATMDIRRVLVGVSQRGEAGPDLAVLPSRVGSSTLVSSRLSKRQHPERTVLHLRKSVHAQAPTSDLIQNKTDGLERRS